MTAWLRVALVALVVAPLPAGASGRVDRGHGMFFNRPGATLEEALAATLECRTIAEGAQSQITTVGVLAGGLGGVLGGAIAGSRLERVNVENCMLIRGWRLFAMTSDEGRAWKALTQDERAAQLALLVGAPTPARGTLLREWRNDYAEPVLWQGD